MPPIVIAAAVTGAAALGASAISSGAQKKAADQAVQANNTASQQQLAEQAKARDLAYSVNAPRLAGGNAAWDALLREHGLDPYAGQAAPSQPGYDPSGGDRPPMRIPQPGDPDYAMYAAEIARTGGTLGQPVGGTGAPQAATYNDFLAKWPDLAAEAQRVVASGEFPSVEAYLQWHAQKFPNENRAPTPDAVAPQTPTASQPGPSAPASPAAPSAPSAPAAGTELMTAARPDAPAAQTFTRPTADQVPTFTRPDAGAAPNPTRPDMGRSPTFTRPDTGAVPTFNRSADLQAPTMQRGADLARPDYGATPQFSNYFDPSKLALDPSYQFRLKQGQDQTNTNFAARGLIKSGAAAKAFSNYNQQAASQEYSNIFNRAMQQYQADLGQYNTGRSFLDNEYQYGQNRADTNYNTDRANATSDYRYGQDRQDQNFTEDRSYGTNLFLNQQQRSDNNFESDRADANSNYRYDTNRSDTNFSNDRTYTNDNYRYATDRADNNFAADRSYDTNLALDRRDFANSNFNSDRGFAEDRNRYDTNRSDTNFNTDRTYQTNRYDTRVANLFDIANAGQNAANGITGAQQTYANNAGNVFGSQANVAADAAASRAQATAGLAGTAAGVASNIFNTYYGNRSSAPASDMGTVNYGNSLNPANYNYAPRVF